MADAKMRPIQVTYEGMGTCIEARIFIGGKRICTIGAEDPRMNDVTNEIISLAKDYLLKKEKRRVEEKNKKS